MELNLIDNLKAEKVKLENLLLNPNNPRLMDKSRKNELNDKRVVEEKVQQTIIKDIRVEGINDLLEKIKKLGFLTIDRIVVRKIEDSENYIVLEGNRRITTAKVLQKEHQEGLITLEENILNSLTEIEVLVYSGDDKNIIWLLQGMRHINGIKEWGALQQSRFLYEMQLDNSLNATELDKMTGLGRNSIANKIRSYKGFIFCQDIYHSELNESNFSLFQEAIFPRPLIKEWLKWDEAEEKFNDIDNLEKLLNWYIGDEEGNTRLTRVLDIRDYFNQLLLPENKNTLIKFIEDENFSINEAIQEVRNKDAEKTAQKHQLDLIERYQNLEELYTSMTTLPIINIINEDATKIKFAEIIRKIKDSSIFQLSILEK
ncbi:ParB/Srx family N-terminal domain-containing protein [Flavobacterium sp. 22076]|uniref:ParB/Srx family N-terminal domain-containing protein n=1 Tax=unclassified Flavobacterium TaxID=196869 RepID=UPI003F834D68